MMRTWWFLAAALLSSLVVSCGPEELRERKAFTARRDALSTGVVISQVYGGGGNGGAPWNADFVELFNRGTTAVDVSNWSEQYASTAANAAWQVASLGSFGVLQPGQYLIVRMSATGANGAALPMPDVSSTPAIAMSATGAKVALVNNSTALGSTGCPAASAYVDLVAWPRDRCCRSWPRCSERCGCAVACAGELTLEHGARRRRWRGDAGAGVEAGRRRCEGRASRARAPRRQATARGRRRRRGRPSPMASSKLTGGPAPVPPGLGAQRSRWRGGTPPGSTNAASPGASVWVTPWSRPAPARPPGCRGMQPSPSLRHRVTGRVVLRSARVRRTATAPGPPASLQASGSPRSG